MKDQKFALVMTAEDKRQLDALARQERISQAAVLRRLIWAAAQQIVVVEAGRDGPYSKVSDVLPPRRQQAPAANGAAMAAPPPPLFDQEEVPF